MSDRQEALQQIVEIAARNNLGADDIREAMAQANDPVEAADEKSTVLTKVLAYLGGIFVFAGLGVFIAMNWDEMNFAARVVITLGSGIAAFIMALVALQDERYEKAATPLFLIAALLEPMGMMVIFEELYSGNEWELVGLIVTGTVGLQQIFTMIKTQRSSLLFTGIIFWVTFFLIFSDYVDMDYSLAALMLGGSLMFLCVGLDKTPHAVITPFWYFIGSSWTLFGLFDMLQGTPVEILFLAAASGFVYLSTVVKSRTLLFVATLAIISYVGYFSAEHFVDSIGWPIALMMFGLLLIGLSALAVRINKKYIRET